MLNHFSSSTSTDQKFSFFSSLFSFSPSLRNFLYKFEMANLTAYTNQTPLTKENGKFTEFKWAMHWNICSAHKCWSRCGSWTCTKAWVYWSWWKASTCQRPTFPWTAGTFSCIIIIWIKRRGLNVKGYLISICIHGESILILLACVFLLLLLKNGKNNKQDKLLQHRHSLTSRKVHRTRSSGATHHIFDDQMTEVRVDIQNVLFFNYVGVGCWKILSSRD